jgi:hypothetical protein
METDMGQEGKKKQRKMIQENYVWRSQKSKDEDPRRAGKEGSEKGK